MMSPFSDVAFTRAGPQSISPLSWRIVGKDAGPRGFAGLRTYIVGHGEVAVIDPDPASRPLLEAILQVTEGERISYVLQTHGHGRRSPLALQLAEQSGATILSGDHGLRDGQVMRGPGWTLEAIATPGHTGDHFAFELKEENALFSGDLVSGWASSVIIPPGGDLTDHLRSLERIRRRKPAVLRPAHGPAVTEVDAFLAGCLDHAGRRERQVLEAIAAYGPVTAWELAGRLYPKVHGLVQPAGAHALLAHLVRLARNGQLTVDGRPSLYASFAAAMARAAA
jgi:glyoxylase-like metal-dependent hydrolase (beta-lactamase superfamily II)